MLVVLSRPLAPPRSVSIRILLGSRESSRQSAQSRNGMVLIRPMWLVVRGSALAVGARGLGQGEGRIGGEEADGLEGEPAVFDRQDRPVLGAREVSRAGGVPEHHALAVERPVVRHELRQASATRVLVDQIAGGVALGWVVAGHPE